MENSIRRIGKIRFFHKKVKSQQFKYTRPFVLKSTGRSGIRICLQPTVTTQIDMVVLAILQSKHENCSGGQAGMFV